MVLVLFRIEYFYNHNFTTIYFDKVDENHLSRVIMIPLGLLKMMIVKVVLF